MGWKGTMRASARCAERNTHRGSRKLERQRKEYSRMEALERAAYEVEVYEMLLSMHKGCGETIKLNRLNSKPEPREPQKIDLGEQTSKYESESYRPNFWACLFNLQARKRAALSVNIDLALAEYECWYETKFKQWKEVCSNWNEEYGLAERCIQVGSWKLGWQSMVHTSSRVKSKFSSKVVACRLKITSYNVTVISMGKAYFKSSIEVVQADVGAILKPATV